MGGVSCAVVAYGQTGSGKTHTMVGAMQEGISAGTGLTLRAAHALFLRLEREVQHDTAVSWSVSAGFLEIYKDQVRDLLAPHDSQPIKLTIREDASGAPIVRGAREARSAHHSSLFPALLAPYPAIHPRLAPPLARAPSPPPAAQRPVRYPPPARLGRRCR